MDKASGKSSTIQSLSTLPKFKVVIIGNQAVGKTSIILRFMHDNFENSYQATIGIDFLTKTLEIPKEQLQLYSIKNNKNIDNNGDDNDDAVQKVVMRLQLWDTAGQERFKSLIPSYIRDSNLAIIVYDVMNVESFKTISLWHAAILQERGSEVSVAIVGNKADCLPKDRKVATSEGEKYARENNAKFFEVSAKTGSGVVKMFLDLSIPMYKAWLSKASDEGFLRRAEKSNAIVLNASGRTSTEDLPPAQYGTCASC
jgi:Ras-related protein Rab-6A